MLSDVLDVPSMVLMAAGKEEGFVLILKWIIEMEVPGLKLY